MRSASFFFTWFLSLCLSLPADRSKCMIHLHAILTTQDRHRRELRDGNSEAEIGRVIQELGWQRSDLVITTKIFFGTGRPDINSRGLSRKHLIEGLNHSLARLRMDYVDVVFAHKPDTTVPMEEVVRAFDWLINKGKAFYWGHSEWSAQQIQEAHEVAGRLNLIAPIAEQPHVSPHPPRSALGARCGDADTGC